ncbi:MAG TPA: GGDEF domain-containing protein [Pseudonocardiaceae bacterium]|jgi:diguanylate cyclase (GGDEF)-like protein|nr:GGDEF domain-containing protein [Pseudonocardiaceae bacterium]
MMVIVVEFVTALVTAAFVTRLPIHQHDLIIFGVLAVGSVLHMELVRGVERIREGTRAHTPHTDLKSVWTFAGLLLLPPALSIGLVVVTCLHQRLRVNQLQTFRWLYNTAVIALSSEAAAAVLYAGLPAGDYPGLPASWTGVAVIILAAAMRWLVNLALVVAIIFLSSPKVTSRDATGGFDTNLVEMAGLALGAVAALVIEHDPWFLVLILPPLLVLHRSLLLRKYELASRVDSKTGLSNAMHWSELARGELARAERQQTAAGVLMLDLDHFKRINDTYGHLTGDAVLKAVADALRRECRDYDLVGRFGGEEFMILTPNIDATDLNSIAERFRRCIGNLSVTSPDTREQVTVTASAGVVVYPQGGSDLDELLLAADAALYRAKESGRNQTCCAPARTPAPPAEEL